MALLVKCAKCGHVVRAGDEWAGKQAKCPGCKARLQFANLGVAATGNGFTTDKPKKSTKSLHTTCSKCGSNFQVQEGHIGKRAKCSKCGSHFVIEAAQPHFGHRGALGSGDSPTTPAIESLPHGVPSIDTDHESSANSDRGKILSRSSYATQNLLPGERILYATAISPMIFAPAVIFSVLIPAGLLFGILGFEGIVFGMFLSFVSIIVTPFLAIREFSAFWNTECVLTDQRIIGKTGAIRRRSLELFLTKVESIGIDQGILGRFFDYGDLTVGGTGGAIESFRGIDKPLSFRKEIQQQIAKVQK